MIFVYLQTSLQSETNYNISHFNNSLSLAIKTTKYCYFVSDQTKDLILEIRSYNIVSFVILLNILEAETSEIVFSNTYYVPSIK